MTLGIKKGIHLIVITSLPEQGKHFLISGPCKVTVLVDRTGCGSLEPGCSENDLLTCSNAALVPNYSIP